MALKNHAETALLSFPPPEANQARMSLHITAQSGFPGGRRRNHNWRGCRTVLGRACRSLSR